MKYHNARLYLQTETKAIVDLIKMGWEIQSTANVDNQQTIINLIKRDLKNE